MLEQRARWHLLSWLKANTLNRLTLCKITQQLIPGVDLIKLFWSKCTHTFCKLDHCINTSNIYSIVMKRYSLQNRVSKFAPKKFYEIDPRFGPIYPL